MTWRIDRVCLWCEQPFTRTGDGDVPDTPPRCCNENHRRKYRLARKKCPVAEKRAFETVQDALDEWAQIAEHNDDLPRLYIYRCACRRYHYTRKPDRAKIGPLTPELVHA